MIRLKASKSILAALFAICIATSAGANSHADHSGSKKTAPHVGTLPEGPVITEADIHSAQKMWGDAVVKIGASGAKAPEVAEAATKAAYAFELGPILSIYSYIGAYSCLKPPSP